MRRWCFNILAALSLLLLVATAALWVRSYWVSDRLVRQSGTWASLSLCGNRGSLDIMRANVSRQVAQRRLATGENIPFCFELDHSPAIEGTFPHWGWSGDLKWNFLGFAYYANPANYDLAHAPIELAHYTELIIPLWPFVLLCAILPLLRFYLWFKRRRVAPGHCLKCGYDLRASKDRCPECGTPIPAGLVKEPIR